MSQPVIISLFILAVVLGAAAAVLEGVIVAVAKLHFGIEKGVRNPEGRRRFKAFQWRCWQVGVFGSTAYSLQEFKEPPYNWLADFSGVVTPLQWVFSMVAVCFVIAAVQRLREPSAN